MSDLNARPRIIHKKRTLIPLSKLMTSEAVKTVSDSPHRMEELLLLLEDRERSIRNRAAATLAHLALLHPAWLVRAVPRLRDSLMDESACVRWNLVHTLGILSAQFPSRMENVLPDILECLDDQNRIVRVFASKALAKVAVYRPQTVEELFRKVAKETPQLVADILRDSGSSPGNVSSLQTIPGTNPPNLDI